MAVTTANERTLCVVQRNSPHYAVGYNEISIKCLLLYGRQNELLNEEKKVPKGEMTCFRAKPH